MDNFSNFAVGQLLTAPNSSATTLTLEAGEGARFPAASYYLVMWDYEAWIDSSLAYHNSKAEIIKVTTISTDTLTVTRAQQGTSAIDFSASADVRVGQGFLAHNIDKIRQDIATNNLSTSYYFDGLDDYVEATSIFGDIDFKSQVFSISAWVNGFDFDGFIGIKPTTGTNFGIQISSSSIVFFRADNNITGRVSFSYPSFIENQLNHISVTYDGNGTPDIATVKVYVNGILKTLLIQGFCLNWQANNNKIFIGALTTETNYKWDGLICSVSIDNRVLSQSEITDLYNNKPEEYKYIGASQTELMPNEADRTFTDPSAWANVDINAYNESDDLTITANVVDQYCTCPVASAPTSIGKHYTMTFDVANIVETWTIESFDGTQTIGTISANGTQQSLSWTAETTGGYRIVAVASTSSADFDNFTLRHTGCVANWNSSGMGHNTWQESENDLFGTVNGATLINIPMSNIEEIREDDISTDTQILSSDNVVPAGYMLMYMMGTETAGNTATLDLGTTAGASDVFSQEVFTASVTTTVAINKAYMTDTKLYLNDDGAGTWNSGVLDCIFVIQRIK